MAGLVSIIVLQKELEGQWQEVIERVGPPEEPSGAVGTTSGGPEATDEVHLGEQDLTSLVNEILERFSAALTPKGAYLYQGEGSFAEAETWATGWLQQLSNGEHPHNPKISSASTLRNALNAACLCRMQSRPDQFDTIADDAYEVGKKIIGRRRIYGD